jgi:hypothetical protein
MLRRMAGLVFLTVATLVPVAASPATALGRTAIPFDGFVITYLPGAVGPVESQFESEWDGVAFHSRFWETGPDPDLGYRVDLIIKTLRGEVLTDLEAVRVFLTEYYEYDAENWTLSPFRVGRHRGYVAADRAFWFVAPGVAAAVTIDRVRFPQTELIKTARGFHLAST